MSGISESDVGIEISGVNKVDNVTSPESSAANPADDNGQEKVPHEFLRAVGGEFLATLMFLFVTLTVVMSTDTLGSEDTNARVFSISVTFGFMICILVYSFAPISGANINPAVSLGLAIAGKISWIRMGAYIAAQCLGALAGASLAKAIASNEFNHVKGGCNHVTSEFSDGSAFLGEVLCTFLLVWTVSAATDTFHGGNVLHLPVLAPVVVGLAVLVSHLVLIPITNCSINPARSLASALLFTEEKCWEDMWIFWLGPLLGGALGALAHRVFVPEKSKALED